MKFLSILPTEFLKDKRYHCSDTTLVLAHLIESDEKYKKACLEFKKRGGRIWCDNSYYERKKNYSIKTLIKIAKSVKSDLVCLPDLPLTKQLPALIERYGKMVRKAGMKVMTVVTCSECFNVEMVIFDLLNSSKYVDVIAIPYEFRGENIMNRWKFLDMIEKEMGVKNLKKQYHLFGVNNIYNIPIENRKWISTIDGTLPFKTALQFLKLPIKPEKEMRRPPNYFNINTLSKKQKECLRYNNKFMRKICKGGMELDDVKI